MEKMTSYTSENKDTRTPKDVLIEMYIAIGLHGVVFLILGMIFIRPVLYYVLALIIGLFAAMVMIYNMYDCLDKGLDMDAEHARSKTTLNAMIRLVVSAGLMVGAILVNWASFVGVCVGLLGIKASAYLNPFITKHIHVNKRK